MNHRYTLSRIFCLPIALVCYVLLFMATSFSTVAQSKKPPHIPYLHKGEHATQFIVNGEAYIIRGGELGNSSFTSLQYMEPIWPKLKKMNLNTVLVPVYWELIEKEEGVFDFTIFDQLIDEARKHDLKLILLWFGSYKNSMSSHVPAWVKQNQDRFPRVKDEFNKSHEILSVFSDNNLEADKKAYLELIKHVKQIDQKEQTIIMVQCENEMGMLPSARDHHSLANKKFNEAVDPAFIAFLQKNKDNLAPHLYNLWASTGFQTKGNWREIFGENQYADEAFMAFYYAQWANELIHEAKEIYPLPMFVNAALNRPKALPGSGYPSAGPLPHLHDIWKYAGPSIDFLAPDFYFPNIEHWCDLFASPNNPLFIPEHRFDETVGAKALFTIGHYQGLGFSPFSIESANDSISNILAQAYHIIEQLSPMISAQVNQQNVNAVLLDIEHPERKITIGNYEFICKHSHTLGWDADAKNEHWSLGSAIIIQTKENEFYIAGSGIAITFDKKEDTDSIVGILKNEEGHFEEGTWIVDRHLNGDQTHQGRHIRMFVGEYAIQRLALYEYK